VAEARQPPSRSEQEALRALLHEALRDLPTAPDPARAADEVMRALDSYVDSTVAARSLAPREAPVTDYERRETSEVRWATWLVVGAALVGTGVVAVVMSGGWPAALAVIAIWAVALIALTTT
jgi:hypothetical protein